MALQQNKQKETCEIQAVVKYNILQVSLLSIHHTNNNAPFFPTENKEVIRNIRRKSVQKNVKNNECRLTVYTIVLLLFLFCLKVTSEALFMSENT